MVDYRELYESLDHNKQGFLTAENLSTHPILTAHTTTHHSTTPLTAKSIHYAQEILHKVGKNGRLTFDPFYTFLTAKENELLDVFNQIDQDNSGSITKSELIDAVRKAGVEGTPPTWLY